MIDADVINITGNDIINLLAGEAINIGSKNIILESDYMSLSNSGLKLFLINLTTDNKYLSMELTNGGLDIYDQTGTTANYRFGSIYGIDSYYRRVMLYLDNNAGYQIYDGTNKITLFDYENTTRKIIIQNKKISIIGDYGGLVDIDNTTGIPIIKIVGGGEETTITSEYITTPNITAGNIDSGTGSINSNQWTWIDFNKTFSSAPCVTANTTTSTNGVMVVKIRDISTTGFYASIGGSAAPSNVSFNWIAIG